MKRFFFLFLLVSSFGYGSPEILPIDVISYNDLLSGDKKAVATALHALNQKGIIGMRGIPEYRTKVSRFLRAARAFSALPLEVKDKYAPSREVGNVAGFELGNEKFMHPDGTWVIEDAKASYYGFIPYAEENIWPEELDLKTPFQEIGSLMAQVGKLLMERIGLIGPQTGIIVDEVPQLGRMLHYAKHSKTTGANPYWCGTHFDHGMFTALLPAFYYEGEMQVVEPEEAGLFVREKASDAFKKVLANDYDVMLFQVGEFGQLISNDAITATEHRVEKATGPIERYTMAVFFDAPMDAVIHSTSVLTEDSRYGGSEGDPCSYKHWSVESFKRYLVGEK